MLYLNLWAGDKIFIPWRERPGIFSGKFTDEDGKLLKYTAAFYLMAGVPEKRENFAQN